ncbi:cytochrome P450 [Corallococcus llansteffanensis]|uniref:Cytochrome P450 n=1 Tax=Corallococcus llansteffanensis TaxID=2316731 RepID=A0A3A8QAV6_9BACT|nr:cytochrome P450 [Corallococcus llansteffanensis]RKH60404.1 cytochrome P450 [Corallococcus llansteffanensis]
MTGTREAPGPRGHWFWGSLRERRSESLPFLLRMHREYGDVAQWRMGPVNRVLSLVNPEHVKHVLVEHVGRYTKGVGAQRLSAMLGNGLLTSEGDFWKRQRRLAQPAFHLERLVPLVRVMEEEGRYMLERWRTRPDPSAPLDLAQEMARTTLSIASRALFSTQVMDEADRVLPALTVAQQEVNGRVLSLLPLPLGLPTPGNRAFVRARQTLDAVVFDIIARRRSGETRGQDLLAMLMEARDADTGEGMTDGQLRDELMTLFIAGYETTANALAWTWSLLSEHPEVEEQARAEVAQVLGERVPTAEDVPRLRYLSQVLEESMRLHPPAWVMVRQALEEDALDGFRIPASPRLIVAISPWVIHRQPSLWPEPERFNPERFSPERSAGRPRLAYLPFGAGQRHCIGQRFAMMEMVLLLAQVLRRYRLRRVPGWRAEQEPLVALRPKGGVPMHLEPLTSP